MFSLFFLGENKEPYSLYYQRVLHCIGAFAYGILIPMAHLLNESRVRNIIVTDGWLRGFRSVFYSASTINRSQRHRVTERRECAADGFNGILM